MVYMFITFQQIFVQIFFENVNGDTAWSISFSGQIGKKLIDFEKFPVANFEIIDSEEINVTKTVLSKDQ